MMLVGRKKLFDHTFLHQPKNNTNRIWIHCASLGEFEMARPLIEAIKSTHVSTQVVITFFSPSGYNVQKNYALADAIMYMPLDTKSNAKKFIKLLKPDIAIMVKYEFWLHHLNMLKQNNISTYLIGGRFHSNQLYFKWFGLPYLEILKSFKMIFTQRESDTDTLNSNGIYQCKTTGDPRYDRVWQHAQTPKKLAIVEEFCTNSPTITLGSSYKPEEKLAAEVAKSCNTKFKWIVAPHEVSEKRIAEIQAIFEPLICIRYSQANKDIIRADVLIIDNVGMLSIIYQYSQVALVGGGFGSKGLHNILEALSMNNYVCIGPKHHQKFPEITEAIENGVAKCILDAKDFEEYIKNTLASIKSESINLQASKYIENNLGATEIILKSIEI